MIVAHKFCRTGVKSLPDFLYLANGTKTSSLTNTSGDNYGLVYRGPFIFRQRTDSAWMMEGVKCPEGKLTESTAFIYLKDHLGSVKAVVDAKSGEVVESSDYSSYGERSLIGPAEYGSERDGATLRAHFTGKEDQMRDFSLDYTDFGARFYSPRVRRWLTPDPLSEKYYGTSPYAYCNGDPINFVDPDGRFIETAIDVGFIVYDAVAAIYHKIKGNDEKASKHLADLGADVIAAAVPGLPAGLTKLKHVDEAVDAVKATVHGNSKLSTKAQHSYDIIEISSGDHVKVGVSSRKVRKDGKSVRAETQVSKLNKEAGYEKYKSEITKTYPEGDGSRDAVLTYEKNRVNEYGNEIDKNIHKRPKPKKKDE